MEELERKVIQTKLMIPQVHNKQVALNDTSGNQMTAYFELTLSSEQWEVIEKAFTMDNEVCLLQERSGNDIIRVLNQVMLVINEWTGADRDYRTRVVLKTDPDSLTTTNILGGHWNHSTHKITG